MLLMRDQISVRAGNGGALGIRFQTRGEQTETVAARGANSRGAAWRGEDKLTSESNYFIGNDSTQVARTRAAFRARGITGRRDRNWISGLWQR